MKVAVLSHKIRYLIRLSTLYTEKHPFSHAHCYML